MGFLVCGVFVGFCWVLGFLGLRGLLRRFWGWVGREFGVEEFVFIVLVAVVMGFVVWGADSDVDSVDGLLGRLNGLYSCGNVSVLEYIRLRALLINVKESIRLTCMLVIATMFGVALSVLSFLRSRRKQ